MNQQIGDLFAKSQALLTLSENQKNELLNKIDQLPPEGQQAIMDILNAEQRQIAEMPTDIGINDQSEQLSRKTQLITAVENSLKHDAMKLREESDSKGQNPEEILNQLN